MCFDVSRQKSDVTTSRLRPAWQRDSNVRSSKPRPKRQAEPEPSVFVLLVVSTGLAVLILGALWFVFFHT
jgi:hypothetical protein